MMNNSRFRTEIFDVVVIGSGPGGYVASIRLGQSGKRVALVEKQKIGGVCLNVGCIPSKALLYAAKTNMMIKRAAIWGFDPGQGSIDPEKVIQWKDQVVKKLAGGITHLLKENRVEVIKGTAVLEAPGMVSVSTDNGEVKLEAESIIVACGTETLQLRGFEFDHDRIIDSTDALSLHEIPPRLLIIGAGITGMEMATYFSGMGSNVAVVEAMDRILPMADREVSDLISHVMEKKGVKILTSSKAVSHEKDPLGLLVGIEKEDRETALRVGKILVTVGRKPLTRELGLSRFNIETDEFGYIKVDEFLRTSNPNIYAIGDITGPPWLAHKASRQGIIAAEVIAGEAAVWDNLAIPFAVFTYPEVAWVGMTEDKARETGKKLKIGKFPYSSSGRALSMDDAEGFVKFISDADTDEILGVHIVCANASDLISEMTLAMEAGATAEDIALTIHPHPTMSEGIMEAAESMCGNVGNGWNRGM